MKEELKTLKKNNAIPSIYCSHQLAYTPDCKMLKLPRHNLIFLDDTLDAKYEPLMRII